MKNRKLFCKLLSALSVIFIGCCGNVFCKSVKAISCQDVVKELSTRSIPFAFGEEYWLFGQEKVDSEHAWQRFVNIVAKEFTPNYIVDTWCEELETPEEDSVEFLYLVLHIYSAAQKVVSPSDATEVVKNMWRGFRNAEEQSNDKKMLDDLVECYKKFNPDIARKFREIDLILSTLSLEVLFDN